MPGERGNPNLYRVDAASYITYAGSSEAVTLPVGTVAVTLVSTTKCWIKVGQPGETATAAAPSGEKVWVQRCFPLNGVIDIAVPLSEDASLVQIAVIQDSTGGTLDILARS